MQGGGLRVEHALDTREVLGAAAFHHVAAHGPWATGEADERHAAIQFLPDEAHCVHHIAQFAFRVRNRQRFYIGE